MKMLTTAFDSEAPEMMAEASRLMGMIKNTQILTQSLREEIISINTAQATHLLKDVRLGLLILCVKLIG